MTNSDAVVVVGGQTEEFQAKATALWDTCTDCEIIKDPITGGCQN